MAFIRVIGDVRVEFVGVWRQPIEQMNVEVATGSGFVIAPSGLVLTNHHVVDDMPAIERVEGREAEVSIENARLEVVVGSGGLGSLKAYVVASEADLDLAVLQVTAADLPYVPFGDSDAAEAGRPVQVLGFPFGRQVEVGRSATDRGAPGVTVTRGSLSATRGDDTGATRYLQTDASVNPGSSGGPMLDEDGYAVGVVRMKLARGPTSQGAGFGVPINLVKDFLEAHGLLGLLPEERLHPGVVHDLDWKKLRVEMPEGFEDTSEARLQVSTGHGEGVSLRIGRMSTPWDLGTLERALLQEGLWPEFAPGPSRLERRPSSGGHGIVGSAAGTTAGEVPFRVEYVLLSLGNETVVAGYRGPPDAVAFNLGLIRRSVASLSAAPLLTRPVGRVLSGTLEPAPYPGGAAGRVPLPAGWSREPVARASCSRVPAPEAGVAASPEGDFTVVFRALRWPAGGLSPEEVARACGASRPGSPRYEGRFVTLGVPTGAWGSFVRRDGEILLLEVEAPESKLGFVQDFYRQWVSAAQ